MARLSKLRREEPETAATIGQFGEKMVALAKAGNMRQLCAMLSSVPEVSETGVCLNDHRRPHAGD
jgi:hypothetical protein